MAQNTQQKLLYSRLKYACYREYVSATEYYLEKSFRLHPNSKGLYRLLIELLEKTLESKQCVILRTLLEQDKINLAHAVYAVNRDGKLIAELICEAIGNEAMTLINKKWINESRKVLLGGETWSIETPLTKAIKEGSFETVRYLIENGANVSLTAEDDGLTPLLLAVSKKDLGMVELLLPKATTQDFNAAMFKAIKKMTNGKMVELLVKHDRLDMNAVDEQKQTFLEIASDDDDLLNLLFQNEEKVFNYFREKQYQQSAINIDANRLLKKTIRAGLSSIVQFLIDMGADVCKTGFDGQTPLTVATIEGNYQICEILLKNGATLTINTAFSVAIEKNKQAMVQLFLRNGADINCTFKNGNTPLIQALDMHNGDLAVDLLKKGADPELRSRDQRRPLSVAVNNDCHSYVQYWILNLMPLDEDLNDASLLLSYCVQAGLLNCVILLIQQGADVNQPDFNGETPLNLALCSGNEDIVTCLLNRGADITTIKPKLMVSIVDNNRTKLLKSLLDHKMDVNLIDLSLLHRSIRTGNVDMIKLLLDRGARVDNADVDLAIIMNNYTVFRMLSERITLSRIPRQWLLTAAEYMNFRIVHDLIRKGADVDTAVLRDFEEQSDDFDMYLQAVLENYAE